MCGRYMCNISYDVISDIFFSLVLSYIQFKKSITYRKQLL